MFDKSLLPKWETLAAQALQCTDKAQRDDASFTLFQNATWFVERHISDVSELHIFEPTRQWTFDLCNETEPHEDSELSAAKKGLSATVEAIRKADPDRVLMYSQGAAGTNAENSAATTIKREEIYEKRRQRP